MKVLLSGSVRALVVAVVTIVVARLLSQPLYNGTASLVSSAVEAFTGRRLRSQSSSKEVLEDSNGSSGAGIPYDLLHSEEEGLESSYHEEDESEFSLSRRRKWRHYSSWITRIKFLAPTITVLVLLVVRPRHFPFAHMSGSIPYTLLELWTGNAEEVCQAGFSVEFPSFPLPDLLDTAFWEPAKGKFPGWTPTGIPFDNQTGQNLDRPPWLPEGEMKGFERWYNETEANIGMVDDRLFRGVNYDPREDPLKISNLDQDVVEVFSQAFKKRRVPIKHVVVVSLETTRKDAFPFKQDSHLHRQIMKTYSSEERRAQASLKLAKLTPNAQLLTGESSSFDHDDSEIVSAKPGSWRNLGVDMGGINVVGAFTGSTSTFKSMLGSHCGVQPLPVDFTVEAGRQIYQPCLPNILNLFNHNKDIDKQDRKSKTKGSASNDFSSMPWKSAFVQSITDQYDRQDELNQHMGFQEVVVKQTLLDPKSSHYPPTEGESNYFGYPETQIKPYLQDLFREAEQTDQRLFLSHFTSSTHHPWNTPEAAGPTVDYLRQSYWGGEHPLNRYLNTIKYTDGWVGNIMDMLEEMNVANETLVVMVGDHGWAFQEDSPVRGTFENGHVSNLRVPLLFHHPSLPRMQLEVNATSMSVRFWFSLFSLRSPRTWKSFCSS